MSRSSADRILQELVQEREARESAPTLESAILRNRYGSYILHRLRFFSLNQLILIGLYWLQFYIASKVFKAHGLGVILIAQNLCQLLTVFWWGALEELRIQIRYHWEARSRRKLARLAAEWSSIARLLSWCTFIAIVLLAAFWSEKSQYTPPLVASILLIGFRLIVEIESRLQTSIVATFRRVYRPFVWIVILEVIGVLASGLLSRSVGPWGYVAANAVTLVGWWLLQRKYNRLALASIRYPRYRRSFRALSRWIRQENLSARLLSILRSGLALVSARIGNLIPILAYRSPELLYVFHVLSPILGASVGWTQVFFFDLRNTFLEFLPNARKKLVRSLVWTSFGIAALLSIVAWVGLIYWTQNWIGRFWLSTGVLLTLWLLVRSLSAIVQFDVFLKGGRTELLQGFTVTLITWWLARSWAYGQVEILLGRWIPLQVELASLLFASLVGLIPFAFSRVRRHSGFVLRERHRCSSLDEVQAWIGEREGVVFGALKVSGIAKPSLERELIACAQASGAMVYRERLGRWWIYARKSEIQTLNQSLWTQTGGGFSLCTPVAILDAPGGERALKAGTGGSVIQRSTLIDQLKTEMGNEVFVWQMEPRVLPLNASAAESSNPVRKQVLSAALRLARSGKVQDRIWEVFIDYQQGSIRRVFAWRRGGSIPERLRQDWRARLRTLDLQPEIEPKN
jgi:hypothetical protein